MPSAPTPHGYRRFGALSSSEDPMKLATTVTGAIKIVGGIVAFAGLTSISGDINTLAEQTGQLVTLGYAFYGLAESTYGIGRKIVLGLYAWYQNH